MKHFLIFFLMLCLVGCNVKHESKTPNILFIYTDDQAPWALGYSGNRQIHTPNLDDLAKQGLYLPNSYTTTPVCSPARAGLLTSQYGFELGIDDWINVKAKTLTAHQPMLGIDESYETWPEILKDVGYITGLIGKWHLGYLPKHHPTRHGYDQFIGFLGGGTTPENPRLEVNGVVTDEVGLTVDILTNYAITFLKKHKNDRFALSLHYRAPHYRFLPVAPEDAALYENVEIALPHPDYPGLNTQRAQKLMREYLSSVSGIDRNVGLLMQTLDHLGLAQNTIVIFTSDHGYNIAHNGMWHKGNGYWLLHEPPQGSSDVPRGQRPNMFDNSLKVPTIIRWLGVIPETSINLSTMSNLDWLPTIVDIAQGNISKNNIVRGKSYLPVFLDPERVVSTDYYAAYSSLHQSVTHMRSYSDGRFKLIKDFNNSRRDEMYDLKNDPEEKENIINSTDPEFQKIKITFNKIITEKMKETNDPVLNYQVFAGDHSS